MSGYNGDAPGSPTWSTVLAFSPSTHFNASPPSITSSHPCSCAGGRAARPTRSHTGSCIVRGLLLQKKEEPSLQLVEDARLSFRRRRRNKSPPHPKKQHDGGGRVAVVVVADDGRGVAAVGGDRAGAVRGAGGLRFGTVAVVGARAPLCGGRRAVEVRLAQDRAVDRHSGVLDRGPHADADAGLFLPRPRLGLCESRRRGRGRRRRPLDRRLGRAGVPGGARPTRDEARDPGDAPRRRPPRRRSDEGPRGLHQRELPSERRRRRLRVLRRGQDEHRLELRRAPGKRGLGRH
mmetsp:Transcript_29542/g.95245  ORF Transcript_29542/g.95245 Transcript_29542/m.95245 type:complete len:291 (+) Transcript_29542:1663-2535(+)